MNSLITHTQTPLDGKGCRKKSLVGLLDKYKYGSKIGNSLYPRYYFFTKGLSRRAKLKRLSIDDQERIIRSRACPTNFDMDYSQSSFEHGYSSADCHAASPSFVASPPLNGSLIYPVMMQDPRYDSEDDHTILPIGMGSGYTHFSSPTSPVSVVNTGEGRSNYNTEPTLRPPQLHSRNSVLQPNYLRNHHPSDVEAHEQATDLPEGYSDPHPIQPSIIQYPAHFQPAAHPRPILPFERNSNTHFDQFLDDTIDINGFPVGHIYDEACEEAPRLNRPYHNPRDHRYQRSVEEREYACVRQFTADFAFRAR